MKQRWVIGIDEVGRGALAGPLVFAAVAARANSKWLIVNRSLRESKRLTTIQREVNAQRITACPEVHCAVVSASNRMIDEYGIAFATRKALQVLFRKVNAQLFTIRYSLLAVLDGGLFAPNGYRQLTIIRGDAQLPIIAAASIIAKVHRDRYMHRQHQRFPQYGFDQHVGYGTRAHYAALRRHGPSWIHRRSFRLT